MNHEVLNRFARGSTLADRSQALSALLSAHVIKDVVDTTEFRAGFEFLHSTAGASDSSVEKLTAVAELSRLAQSYPPLSERVQAALTPILRDELPALSILPGAKERDYVAKALVWAEGSWTHSYCALAIATEPAGENARLELMCALMRETPSIAVAITAIVKALDTVEFTTNKPIETEFKRLIRILAALRKGLLSSRLTSGDEIGDALRSLVQGPLGRIEAGVDQETAVAMLREVLLCTYDLVRTRFSLASDDSIYGALKAARRTIAPGGWPGELANDADLLADIIQESLLLVARQGLTSSQLRRILEVVTDVERSDSLLLVMAQENPQLDEPIRAWLSRRPQATASVNDPGLQMHDELRADPRIGECLLAAKKVSARSASISEDVAASLDIFDPPLAGRLRSFVSSAESLCALVERLARARRLQLLGVAGTEIEYSAKYFEPLEGAPRPRMLVVESAVVRLSETGEPGHSVVKGIVK